MADPIVADSATPPPEGPPYIPLTPERQGLALEAAWELEMISINWLRQLNRKGAERHEPLQYRALAARAKELSTALIAALDDDVEEVAEVRRRIYVVEDE